MFWNMFKVKNLTVWQLQDCYIEVVASAEKERIVGGLVLVSSIMIGFTLVVSEQLFQGSVLAWFVSATPVMGKWRIAILGSLICLALVRMYYHNLYTRIVWASASLALMWAGVSYLLDNAQFIFDALFMLVAGISFAITAIQQSDEPVAVESFIDAVLPGVLLAYYSHLWRPAEHLAYRNYLGDSSHRLVIKRPGLAGGRT